MKWTCWIAALTLSGCSVLSTDERRSLLKEIERLESPSIEERDDAFRRIVDFGPNALALIRDRRDSASDLEVRLRLDEALEAIQMRLDVRVILVEVRRSNGLAGPAAFFQLDCALDLALSEPPSYALTSVAGLDGSLFPFCAVVPGPSGRHYRLVDPEEHVAAGADRFFVSTLGGKPLQIGEVRGSVRITPVTSGRSVRVSFLLRDFPSR